jgi:hypothetical protein
MPFEVQPERAPVGKGRYLPLEILRECGFPNSQFAKQFVQA